MDQQAEPGAPAARPSGARSAGWLDGAVVATLVLLTLALRVPLIPPILPESDAGAYAIGADRFDIHQQHPHPPGYHSYLVLVQLARPLVGGRTDLTLYLLSICFAGLAVAALYLVGRDWYGRAAGVAAGLVWAVSPAMWRISMMAQSHMAEVALCTLTLWAVWRRLAGGGPWWWLAALFAGAAMAVRPQAALVVVPVLIYGLRRTGAWRGAAALGITAACVAVSEAGAALATGSWQVYRAAAGIYWDEVIYPLSPLAAGLSPPQLLEAIQAQMAKFSTFVFGGGSHATVIGWILPFAYGVGHVFRPRALRADARTHLLLLWTVPVLLFHLIVHVNTSKHVQVYYPMFMLVMAAGIGHFCREWATLARPHAPRPWTCWIVLAGIAVCVNLAVTLAVVAPGFGRNARELDTQIRHIKERFEPAHALVIQSDLRQHLNVVEHYLADYPVVMLEQTQPLPRPSLALPSPMVLAQTVRHAVFVNPEARVSPPGTREVIPGGIDYVVVDLDTAGRVMHFDAEGVRFSTQ